MKKTLVALAVAAIASTSASAATLYNQDGTAFDISGSVRLLATQNKGQRTALEDSGSRAKFSFSQDLGDGMAAIGALRLRFESGDTVEWDQGYAGFYKDGVGVLTFGKQDTVADSLGLSDFTYEYGGVNQTTTYGVQAINFMSAPKGGFSWGANYTFNYDPDNGTASNSNSDPNQNSWGAGLFYAGQLNDNVNLEASAGFTQDRLTDDNGKRYNGNAYIASVAVNTGALTVGVDYSQRQNTNDVNDITVSTDNNNSSVTLDANRIQLIELGAHYQYMDNASVYGEYIWGSSKAAETGTKGKRRQFILGTDYNLADNVVTYLEVTKNKITVAGDSDTDNQAAVGFRVYF